MSDKPPVARTQQKKPSYPISDVLRAYLHRYRRERALPVTYARLRSFADSIPMNDAVGKPTLWETVFYNRLDMESLHNDLKRVYALIRVDGDLSVMKHLYIDRIDFCAFGNSAPFRIRIVNSYNENPDYFYVKRGDSSRVYAWSSSICFPPTASTTSPAATLSSRSTSRAYRATSLPTAGSKIPSSIPSAWPRSW